MRLIRKLAEEINGIDLSGRHVGEVLDLSPRHARMLVAEGWATTKERRRENDRPAHERRRRVGPPLTGKVNEGQSQAIRSASERRRAQR